MKLVTIQKEKYLKLKQIKNANQDLLNQLIGSLEDIKAGRIRRVA